MQAARAWRRDRRLFDDQIYRRPWHVDGGAIIDGGNFDWEKFPERQPALNTPDASYHGAVWVEAVRPLGPVAYIIKARTTLLRDLSAAPSPFNSFLTLQGIENLQLRIERHVSNAQAVADFSASASRSRK